MQIKGYNKKMLASSFIFKIYVLQIFFNNAFGSHHMEKRMVLETCLGQFDMHPSTIIRTGESQTLGGKYLEGVALDNINECQRLCCETDNCDVYIFEDKHEGFCYLFNCGPPENFHCKFTRHTNYTSAVLLRPRDAPESPVNDIVNDVIMSQNEMDLTNLKDTPKRPHVIQKEEKVDEALSNTAAEKAQTTPNPVNVLPQCGRFQFTCHSGECIAVYNACDGIPQCADGSDEGPECSGAPAKVNTNDVTTTTNSNKMNVLLKTTEPTVTRELPKPKKIVETPEDSRNQKMVAEIQNQLSSNSDLVLLEGKKKHSPRVVHLKNSKPIHTISQSEPAQPGNPNTPPLGDIYVGPITREDGVMSADIVFGAHYLPKPGVRWTPSVPVDQKPVVKNSQNIPQTTSSTVAVENTKNQIEIKKDAKPQHAPQAIQTPKSTSKPATVNTDDDGDDYEEKVTEQPKKKLPKNKKQKPKIDDVEMNNKPNSVQEQHKAIHEDLGLEFHDHDGHAERPGGAMISLTLGLLVTAALAIVIGCRMRTVRRRMRRPGGKGFSHDSDFLVNGMYL